MFSAHCHARKTIQNMKAHLYITRHICHALGIALTLCALGSATISLGSCSGDDNDGSSQNASDNSNANSTATNKEYGRMEMPRIKKGSRIIIHSTTEFGVNYIVEWDDGLRSQRWTCYRMDDSNSKRVGSRSQWWGETGDPFAEDNMIPAPYRTTLQDYSKIYRSYQRGHICPSGDRLNSKEANKQTFLLSNIQPQIGGFNSGVWLYMETKIRGGKFNGTKVAGWNTDSFRDTLYICKGGTIDNNNFTYASSGIIVPKYFFAAILRVKNGNYNALGLWFEHKSNHSTDLKAYACSIDELEAKTGIDFFCNLPDKKEKVIEAAKPNEALWGIQ